MNEQEVRHPFCDFALTKEELTPGASVAEVGILLMPQFWETGIAYVEEDADRVWTSDGYSSTMSSMGIIPYDNGNWAPKVTFHNTAENRQRMFDLLLIEEALVAAESAVAMARAHPDQFQDQISKAEEMVRHLRPAGSAELVIHPI